MPYDAGNAPPAVKALPKGARDIWIAAFNSAFEQYDGNEAKSHATAWAAVGKKYRKSGDNWVLKSEDGDEWIAVNLDALGDILVVPDFVSIVGSVAKAGRGETMDVLFRQAKADETLKNQVQKVLVGKAAEINPIWNPAGPHGTYMPLFDLVLRAKSATRRRILDGAKSPYRIAPKGAEGEGDEVLMEALKASDELQTVWGVVMKANEPDTQNQAFTAEGIREAMHEFNAKMLGKRGKIIKDQHGKFIDGEVVESYQTPSEVSYDGKTVPKDAWVMAVKVWDKSAWQGVKAGRLTGLSPKILWRKEDAVMKYA